MSVRIAAFAVAWARLWMGFHQQGSDHCRNSGCAQGRVRGGIVGTVRILS